jgi:alkylated DNA nucleotide flippase Atl1
VVNKSGGLAAGFPKGGRARHKKELEAEGVSVSDDFKVDIDELIWWPDSE